jgi:hypothetical protein
VTVQPLAQVGVPETGGQGAEFKAVAELGGELGQVAAKIQQARDHTQAAEATTDFLTRQAELEDRYRNDKDYANAGQKFVDEQRKLEKELSERISNGELRQRTVLGWRRAGIAAGRRVNDAANTRMVDAGRGELDAGEFQALRDADSAGSTVERQAVIDRHLLALRGAADNGIIDETGVVARRVRFETNLSRADVMREIRRDPANARRLLDDPKMYAGLDPVSRESFKNTASSASDQLVIDRARVMAVDDPEGARKLVDKIEQPHHRFQALEVIDSVQKQQDREWTATVKAAASIARSGDDVVDLVKKGYDVAPERVEAVRSAQLAAAQRGDEAAAKYVRELDQQIALQPYVRRAWSTSPAELDGAIKGMEAELTAAGGNATVGQVLALNAFKGVRDEINKRRDAEPIVLGGEGGARFYRLGPLDAAAAPEDPALRRELAARDGHAIVAQRNFGGKASVFTAEEARAFKDRWTKAGPDEQFRLLRSFGETLSGRAYDDTVTAIAGDDPTTAFVGRLAQDRPELAREVLQGTAILGDGKTKEKSSAVREVLADKLGGAVYPSPAMQETAINAALALDASRRAGKGALYDPSDVSGLDKAIDDVTGAIVKRNGAKFPITPGIPRNDFLGALDRLTAEQVKLQGGAIDREGRELDPRAIADRGILKPLSIGGRYYAVGLPDPKARDGFAPVLDLDGRPLVFDMAALAAERPGSLGPTSYAEGRRTFKAGQFERLRQAREEGGPAPPPEPPRPRTKGMPWQAARFGQEPSDQ